MVTEKQTLPTDTHEHYEKKKTYYQFDSKNTEKRDWNPLETQ